ncbi:MAG: YaeQ family protein [Myxococcota bacterium]
MAAGTTIVRFDITLSDVDRGVYDTLELRVAQHPSESDNYLLTRVLAYALEFEDDLSFSKGLSTPDEPALWSHDPTGALTRWIEVGNPKPDRIHRASKASPTVRIYTYKDLDVLRRSIAGNHIHRIDEIDVVTLPDDVLAPLAANLGRANTWTLLRSDGELYVTVGDVNVSCPVLPVPLSGD